MEFYDKNASEEWIYDIVSWNIYFCSNYTIEQLLLQQGHKNRLAPFFWLAATMMMAAAQANSINVVAVVVLRIKFLFSLSASLEEVTKLADDITQTAFYSKYTSFFPIDTN